MKVSIQEEGNDGTKAVKLKILRALCVYVCVNITLPGNHIWIKDT